ncbi:MAG: tRNA lysidine(34) synthetase TilS, partial [Synergistetes bacterium]|nr:tRNA lysidine(34) synthetase TilS [Synergistota bacterium]
GGVDSVVLLDLLVNLAPLYDLKLHVVHLDHGIRDIDSYEDSIFVQELALRYGLGFTMGKIDARVRERGESVEEGARRLRYSFLRRCLDELKAHKIALAHHADDQVETLIMRILRGTGPSGLCGMRPKNPPYVRPLLNLWRSEIEEYALEKGLSYRVDLTNYDTHYFRNKVRHLLFPLLEEYSPSFKEGLLRLSELMWIERDFIEVLLEKEYRSKLLLKSEDKICFDSRGLRSNKFIFLELLRRAIEELCGSTYGFSKEDLDRVWENAFGVFDLPKGIRVKDDGKSFCVFLRGRSKDYKEEWLFELKIPGITNIPGGMIKSDYVSHFRLPENENEAFFDAEKLRYPLFVRNRREGDRFTPLGMKGVKKLKKLLMEASIPREERGKIPIVVDGEGDIIWIAGVRRADKAKVDENTRKILHLVYIRGESG